MFQPMPLVLGNILENTFVFLTLVVSIFGFVGLFSRSFVVASFCTMLGFVTVAIESQYSIYITMLYLLVPTVLIIMSFQFYNLTQNSNSGASV